MGAQPGRSAYRAVHPKLQMMQERVKKMRTHAEAQEGARQILGLSPGVPTMGSNHCARALLQAPRCSSTGPRSAT
jgi:hypothetical protein